MGGDILEDSGVLARWTRRGLSPADLYGLVLLTERHRRWGEQELALSLGLNRYAERPSKIIAAASSEGLIEKVEEKPFGSWQFIPDAPAALRALICSVYDMALPACAPVPAEQLRAELSVCEEIADTLRGRYHSWVNRPRVVALPAGGNFIRCYTLFGLSTIEVGLREPLRWKADLAGAGLGFVEGQLVFESIWGEGDTRAVVFGRRGRGYKIRLDSTLARRSRGGRDWSLSRAGMPRAFERAQHRNVSLRHYHSWFADAHYRQALAALREGPSPHADFRDWYEEMLTCGELPLSPSPNGDQTAL